MPQSHHFQNLYPDPALSNFRKVTRCLNPESRYQFQNYPASHQLKRVHPVPSKIFSSSIPPSIFLVSRIPPRFYAQSRIPPNLCWTLTKNDAFSSLHFCNHFRKFPFLLACTGMANENSSKRMVFTETNTVASSEIAQWKPKRENARKSPTSFPQSFAFFLSGNKVGKSCLARAKQSRATR